MNEQEQLKQQLKDFEEKCIYQDTQIARLMNDNKDTYQANQQLTQQILSLDNIVNQLIMENQFLRNENDQIKQNSYKAQSNFYSTYSDQEFFEPNQEISDMISQKQKKLKELKLIQQKEESKPNQSNKIVQSLLDEVIQDKIMNLQMDITALQQLLQQ
ncbi:unnamed protein product [Paramecium pentaurelia]|uniref:Uncharacterized protein n=1 Tax=Paramecium pentaurelia TaxID=43138 RepID=A0A8S1SUR5_9CILI|nr:unnamed protein product [Paramecium pentaurelia]